MIRLKEDIFKIKYEKTLATWTMVSCAFLMMIIIIGSIIWMGEVSFNDVENALAKKGKDHDIDTVNGYIKWRAVLLIVQNFIVISFFSGMVLWSFMSGKRFGLGFAGLWLLLFGMNLIGVLFASPIYNWTTILSIIANIMVFICILNFTILLMQHRANIKQQIAKGKI